MTAPHSTPSACPKCGSEDRDGVLWPSDEAKCSDSWHGATPSEGPGDDELFVRETLAPYPYALAAFNRIVVEPPVEWVAAADAEAALTAVYAEKAALTASLTTSRREVEELREALEDAARDIEGSNQFTAERGRREMPDVGDGPCGRCGGNNPAVWFASPNERWNEVYGNGAGLRCPNCFFADAIEAGFDRIWAFIAEDEKELAWQSRWEHGRDVGREEGATTSRREVEEAIELLRDADYSLGAKEEGRGAWNERVDALTSREFVLVSPPTPDRRDSR